jgi:hypothetical protein
MDVLPLILSNSKLSTQLVNGSYTIWVDDDGYLAVPTKANEITSLIIGNAGLNNEATITVRRGTGCQVNARSR